MWGFWTTIGPQQLLRALFKGCLTRLVGGQKIGVYVYPMPWICAVQIVDEQQYGCWNIYCCCQKQSLTRP